MKLFALLFIVGFAGANPVLRWESGKEYRFDYSGRLLNGLPELSSQFSGLAINATVSLKVKEGRIFSLSVEEPKFVAINHELQAQEGSSSYDEGNNWRRLRLPEMTSVAQEYASTLKKPIVFTMEEDGSVKKIQIEHEEPLWSRNFKKALVNLLQTKTTSEGHMENMISSSGSVEQPYWSVMEQSISGECETTYQINWLPEYLVRDTPALNIKPELCQGKKHYEIVRTVNLEKCSRMSTFQKVGTGEYLKCSPDMVNCANNWSGTYSIKYSACGSRSSGKMTVQSIISDGEMNTHLLGQNNEMLVTGTRQNLTLLEINPTTQFPQPESPVTLDGLWYDFTSTTRQNSIEGDFAHQQSIRGRIPSESVPATYLSALQSQDQVSGSDMGQKILNVLDGMAKDIHGQSGTRLSESQLGMKLLTAARGFSTMKSSDEIKQLFTTIQRSTEDIDVTKKQLFLDACAIAGTQPVVEFFEHVIQNNLITGKEIANYFFWLPHNVLLPYEETLKGLFNTVTSEVIKSKAHIYKVGITALTQLVEQACVGPQRKDLFPTRVYGEFCNPESKIVQEVLIPYLSKEMRKSSASESYQNINIVALGMLTHKNVIGELTPLIEETQGRETSLRRILAIYSLVKVGTVNPNLVTPILQTLFTNPSESTEVRISAFNSLLKLNPPTQVFNTIAHTTRQEPDMDYELLKTINIALYTLGHSVQTTHLPQEKVELMQKCRDAYVVVKKTYGITPSSGSYYKVEFLKDFGVGYQGYVQWISSQESILPKSIFTKLTLFLESFSFNVFEIGYRLRGVESLYEKVSDALNGHSGQFSAESLRQKVRQGLSTEWKNVMEKLELKNRESSKVEGSFYLRGFGSGVFLESFSEATSHSIQEKIVELIRSPSLSSVNGETKVNVQKSFVTNPITMVIPSAMGFPVDMEVYTPVTASFYGKMNLNSDKSNPSVSVEGKLLYSSQLTGWAGTIVPFTQEYTLTGIDQHALLHVPGSIKIEVSVPEQKMSVTVKPGAGSRSGETDVLHYHVQPYTVKEKILSLVPHTKSQNMKIMKSNTPKKIGQYRFGQNLGLSLKTEYQTESMFTDLRSILETFRMYKYNPINMIVFPHTTPAFDGKMRPSTRQQKYTVTINPSDSSTKEIQTEVKIGCATKEQDQQFQYHSIKPISNSERLSSQEQQESVEGVAPSVASLVKKILPYRVQSEPIQSTSKHPSRTKKIQEVLQELGQTDSAQGVSINTMIVLKGNRPRTFGYSLTIAGGKQDKDARTEQKWNLNLESTQESETLPKKICINGKMDFPLLPMWNINDLRTTLSEFYYKNKIAFGQTCAESSISTNGISRVSHKQKSHAVETPESRMCQQLTQHQLQGSQLSQVCQKAREQASSLDEIEFTTEFNNVPQVVRQTEKRTVTILKALLWPYYNFKTSSIHSSESEPSTYQTKTILIFKQKTPSFDLTIQRPKETINFVNVHIPEPYSIFFPLKAGMTKMSLVRKLSGSSIFPTCKVTTKTITSYDNKTISFNPDKCFHLLTADCSKYNRFGVSTRKIEGEKLEVKVYLKKTIVQLTPSGSEGPKVTVDGKPIEVRVNQETVIRSQQPNEETLATLTKSVDGVLIMKAPAIYLPELAFNGKLISIVPSPMLKNKLCGLCGDYNQERNADISGPKQCVFSKPELKIASYRIQSQSCPTISSSVKQQLLRETQQCSKYQVHPTKVAQGYKINTGKCIFLRHIIMQQNEQICISKVPVTQCGPSCKTIKSELVEKTVPFVCLPQGRLADNYVWKVQQGMRVDELRSMSTSFETKMNQPRHCVHALVSGSSPF